MLRASCRVVHQLCRTGPTHLPPISTAPFFAAKSNRTRSSSLRRCGTPRDPVPLRFAGFPFLLSCLLLLADHTGRCHSRSASLPLPPIQSHCTQASFALPRCRARQASGGLLHSMHAHDALHAHDAYTASSHNLQEPVPFLGGAFRLGWSSSDSASSASSSSSSSSSESLMT